LIGATGAIIKFLRLTFLRPIERFLAQVISISTDPAAFVRERIRLGDTTNFLRSAGFFVSAISTAFLAEVATLYRLGIGNLTEPYYWAFILLTSIPFVLLSFLSVRFVAPLSFKDVLHLSFHPIGAGVFVGAAFAWWHRLLLDRWLMSAISQTSDLILASGVKSNRTSLCLSEFCLTASKTKA
jgi:hypothetical protein